ncbi:MAG: GNAT family N-acetyltransferase [Deltaproteobacteria bacterium]|nr:GNAT family N-acetyltransferase [Deltaproteobacteria bacterium]
MRTRVVSSEADLQQAYAIRFRVFVDEQQVPAEEELDALDAVSLHVLVLDGDQAVATGRLIPPDATHAYAKIGRMAVLASHRRRGAGRLVMEFLLQAAGERRWHEVRLAAQDHAIPFYEAMGFCTCSDGFVECGIAHHWMRRVL